MPPKNAATQGRPSPRRQEILDAAATVISEKGFKEATVRDIGDAAGILSGSLYHHFDSKEQIILDLLLPSVKAQYEEVRALIDDAPTRTEALRALIRSSVSTTAANPHKTVILRNSGRTFTEFERLAPINQLRVKSLDAWIEVVNDGIAAGEFRDDIDPVVAVHGMLDAVLGAARWFINEPNEDPEKVIDTLTKTAVSSLTRA